jgi:hypothetical protein
MTNSETREHSRSTACDCGCMGFGPLFKCIADAMQPRAGREHFQNARIEFLKGIRAVVDARIDHLSRRGTAAPGTSGTTVPVE